MERIERSSKVSSEVGKFRSSWKVLAAIENISLEIRIRVVGKGSWKKRKEPNEVGKFIRKLESFAQVGKFRRSWKVLTEVGKFK